MGNILVLRGADFSDAKIGTRTVPEATTSSGLYFRYIDSFTVTQSLTGCTSTNSTEHVQDGGTFETTLNASAGYNDITQDMITVVDTNNNPVSFTFSGKTLRIENITTDIRITVTSTIKQVTLESIAVSGYATSPVNIDTGSDKAYYSSTNNLKNKIAVTATFSDGATQPVAAADYTLTLTSGGNLTTEGTKKFTVSYTYNNVTKTETFNVEYVYQYYTVSKSGVGNATSIVETIDNVQTSNVTRVRWHQDYSITINVPDNTTTATVTINGATNTYAPVNNVISITVTDVEAVININIIAAEQTSELETPLYFKALQDNTTIKLEHSDSSVELDENADVMTGETYDDVNSALQLSNILQNLQYSTDNVNWSQFPESGVTLNTNDCVYLRGTNPRYCYYAANNYMTNNDGTNEQKKIYKIANVFTTTATGVDTAKVEAHGNIMSLIQGENFVNNYSTFTGKTYGLFELFSNANITTLPLVPCTDLNNVDGCFAGLFSKCKYITTIPTGFTLSASVLPNYAYMRMFSACNKLQNAPELPAIDVSDGAYAFMFISCFNLLTPPILGCTGSVKTQGMQNMFYACLNMGTTLTLPAQTLYKNAYRYMLPFCRNINKIELYANSFNNNASIADCLANWTNSSLNKAVSSYSSVSTSIKPIGDDSAIQSPIQYLEGTGAGHMNVSRGGTKYIYLSTLSGSAGSWKVNGKPITQQTKTGTSTVQSDVYAFNETTDIWEVSKVAAYEAKSSGIPFDFTPVDLQDLQS